MNAQLLIGQVAEETNRERGRRELRESLALDPRAGDVGAEENLVYAGPRGERGFPICEADGCRRESCGPFSYHCTEHHSEVIDD